MFTLKQVKINKYKSYTTEQEVQLDDSVTTLVGKNESGKTAFLEALAKLNYFTSDEDFKFDAVQDYPRNELKKYQRSGDDIEPIVCTFQLDREIIDQINTDLGEGVLITDSFSVSSRYGSGRVWYHINSNEAKYLENLQVSLEFNDEVKTKILALGTVKNIAESDPGEDTDLKLVIDHIKNTIVNEGFDWERKLIDAYITKKYISPKLPRFWYFDEYHELPSRISIDAIRRNSISGELTKQQLETAKALFELAMIDIE